MEHAIQNTIDRRYNPINIVIPELRPYMIIPKDRRYGRNIDSLRGVIQDIINDRRSGNSQCYNADGSEDLLSILLKEDFYDTDDKMIDELCTFFLAGMKTIQLTTANLIMYLTQVPEYKKKFLDETMPSVEAAKENIVEELTYETVSEFQYLQYCFSETLRIEPPAPATGLQSFTKDVKIKGITFSAGDPFMINIKAMHHDPTQWQEPSKFIPERFDTESTWSLTPSGKNRNPLTFNPFLGGKRVCLGKTFAETVIRFTLPILFYHFEFDFVNESQRRCKPKVDAASTATIPVPMTLSQRNKVKVI